MTSVSERTEDPRLPRWILLAMLVGIGLAFVFEVRAWSFLADDAFISFRYARNLAAYGQLVFNLGERVEGYSNFAWVLLLGIFARVGLQPHEVAPVLTITAMAGVLVVAGRLVQVLGGRAVVSPFHALAPLWLVASAECMVWSHGGLETSAATLASLYAIVAWVEHRWRWAAAAAAASALLRLDAALPVAVFGLTWLVVPAGARAFLRDRPWPWRQFWTALAIFIVPVCGHWLWRYAYYDAWWPNTWAVKTHGALLRSTYGEAYVAAWVEAIHLPYLAVLIVFLRTRHLVLLFPITAVIVYGYAVGGDFMAYSRFYLSATVLLAVLVAWVFADLGAWLAPRYGTAASVGLLGLGVALALVMGLETRRRWLEDRDRGPRWLGGLWEGVTAMDRFAAVGWIAGRWMHDHLPPDTLISVGAAGAVPYSSGLPVLDAYGLVDATIPTLPAAGPHAGKGARPGHQLFAPPAYVKRRDPDLLCHVGYRGPQPPGPRLYPPGYRRGYTWACIPVGDVQAGGERFDGGYYCCLRPADRPMDPWKTL